jgi:putative copper export protein
VTLPEASGRGPHPSLRLRGVLVVRPRSSAALTAVATSSEGAHVFVVGAAAGGRPALAVPERGPSFRLLARWLVAAGAALLLGVVAARPLLGLPPRGPGSGRWLEVVGGAGVLAGVTLDLGLLAYQLAGPGALSRALPALVWTPSGAVWLARCAGVLLLLGLWALDPASPRRWPRIARAALAAGILVAGALTSHSAATTEGRWLALAAEAVHLLAMALWTGGLVAFATVLWRPASLPRFALAVPAFSQLALAAVGLLALAGLTLARPQLRAWDELFQTPYGRLLLTKVVVVAAMLLVASGHLRRHASLLTRGVTDAAARSVRRRLRLEAGLGVTVLVLAALLASTQPPDPPPEGGLEVLREVAKTPEANLHLEVTPFRPAPLTVRLAANDPRGFPLSDAGAARLRLVPRDGRLDPLTLHLERVAPGLFVAQGAAVGMAREWEGRLLVQRDGASDVDHRFTVLVPAAFGPPVRRFPLDVTTGVAAAVTVLETVALFRRSRRRLQASRAPGGGGDGGRRCLSPCGDPLEDRPAQAAE